MLRCDAVWLTEGVVVTTNGSYHRRHVPVKEKRQIRKLADFPEACWKLNLNPHPLKNQMPKGAPPKKSQMQSKVNGVAHPPRIAPPEFKAAPPATSVYAYDGDNLIEETNVLTCSPQSAGKCI